MILESLILLLPIEYVYSNSIDILAGKCYTVTPSFQCTKN